MQVILVEIQGVCSRRGPPLWNRELFLRSPR